MYSLSLKCSKIIFREKNISNSILCIEKFSFGEKNTENPIFFFLEIFNFFWSLGTEGSLTAQRLVLFVSERTDFFEHQFRPRPNNNLPSFEAVDDKNSFQLILGMTLIWY